MTVYQPQGWERIRETPGSARTRKKMDFCAYSSRKNDLKVVMRGSSIFWNRGNHRRPEDSRRTRHQLPNDHAPRMKKGKFLIKVKQCTLVAPGRTFGLVWFGFGDGVKMSKSTKQLLKGSPPKQMAGR